MFGLFNAIYWTHVKMAADSSREPLAKNFAPGETEINWDYHLADTWWRQQKRNFIKRLGQKQNIIHLCQKWIKQAKFIVLYMCFPQIVCAKSRRKISQNKEAIFIELVSTHVFQIKTS